MASLTALALQGQVGLPKPAETFADTIVGKDPVSSVNIFCQRFAARPITRDEVVYTNLRLATGGYQCTLKLDCLGGLEFAGEVFPSQVDAKKSAAQQVLDHFATEIAGMPACAGKNHNKNTKKRKADTPLGRAAKLANIAAQEAAKAAVEAAGPVLPPNVTNKADLHQAYSKIVRRSMGKSEVVYQTQQVMGGFQSQVQLPGLPEPWNVQIWAGEVHPKKADAEQSVAGIALSTLRGDPALMAAHNAPQKPNQWIERGGLQRQREQKEMIRRTGPGFAL